LYLRTLTAVAATTALLFFTGCASKPQLPVALNPAALSTSGTRIGVAMTALPKVDTYFPGADCLLCIAAASVANSSLTTHSKSLGYEDLSRLKALLSELIRKRGGEAVVIAEDIKLDAYPDRKVGDGVNESRKDFSALQAKHRIDKLLLVDIGAIGFRRTYAAYFPTSDPKAILTGSGALIDLKTQVFDWYGPLAIARASDGAWDEPPKYPGLSNAYFQMLELGKDEVLKPFMP
jgi:hypothetical protein